MCAQAKSQERHLLALLSQLNTALRCCRQDVFCEGLSFNQFLILDMASQMDDLPLGRLHLALGVDKSTTTRLVKPLLERGLLVRRASPGDGRAAWLGLTPQGRAALEAVWGCVRGFLGDVNQALPAGQRAQVLGAVGLFVSAMGQAWSRCCVQPSQIGERPHAD